MNQPNIDPTSLNAGKRDITVGAIILAIAVAAGAFGAHGLRGKVTPHLLEVWKTAASYQTTHGLGLVAIGFATILLGRSKALRVSSYLMLAGFVLFSGSLYAMTLTGIGWLGAITPFGGLSWIIAWILLAFAAFQRPAQTSAEGNK